MDCFVQVFITNFALTRSLNELASKESRTSSNWPSWDWDSNAHSRKWGRKEISTQSDVGRSGRRALPFQETPLPVDGVVLTVMLSSERYQRYWHLQRRISVELGPLPWYGFVRLSSTVFVKLSAASVVGPSMGNGWSWTVFLELYNDSVTAILWEWHVVPWSNIGLICRKIIQRDNFKCRAVYCARVI